ncbi:VOC family protein [Microlunatus speluncae]|uniref:VOC family protein n=1 Tax=Microlunatus speluncae TaxID=2594267 RepID=UPI001266195B|nr:VOC family protein [Microlunatus speluncae]
MNGQPSYIELGVPDADAARTFYGALLGWRPSGAAGPGSVSTPTLDIGLHGEDPQPGLLVFLDVDDLDAAIGRVAELGGQVHGPVVEDEGFGRFAVCTDDQGVRFALRRPS